MTNTRPASIPECKPTSSRQTYQKPTLTAQGNWQHLTTQVGSFPFEP